MDSDRDFIDDGWIEHLLEQSRHPDRSRIREILARALSLVRLEPAETAALLQIDDADLWPEVFETAREIKNKVYGPRIVTFAPLYCSNLCTNSCLYCGFRRENGSASRRRLSIDEVRRETEALVQQGHKRLVVVYGEHPTSSIDYQCETIEAIYKTRVGHGEIRRVNVNAAPLSISDYRRLKEVGIGTFQVFQETYHHETYRKVHPRGKKADYDWRLYALHRAQEAGIDDVAIGALFGLYDWRFEVIGLLLHAIDLERKFGGVGPHTISFPRLEPAAGAPIQPGAAHAVSDEDFKRLVAVLRCSVPYTGLIITAREPAEIRRDVINVGCTQTDASSRIGIGAYAEDYGEQQSRRQQFMLGDTRDLDEVVRDLAEMGYLTSFCTAGYRCGRTGVHFMSLARSGNVHRFCIPNAILTFKEYLVDFASDETRAVGEKLIEKHIRETVLQPLRPHVRKRLAEIENGKRDIWF
ncbi:MAG: [FeFe] hydrogenase H-cluster radical SAM maturase HydG [Deltaproteobacteria bacterium]|nr:[FeFe] hydrogenase H-cluster radical SAM maturase HydG [Deltaproteobacteria bacterium]